MKLLRASMFVGFTLTSSAAFAAMVGTYTPTGDPNSASDSTNQNSVTSDLWTYYSVGNSGTAGSYLKAAASNPVLTSPAWATYSISHSATIYTNAAVFGGALTTGQTVSLSLADETVGSQVAVNLLSGGYPGTTEFSLYVTSSSPNWLYTDSSGTGISTGIAASTTDNSLVGFSFDLTGSGTYSATFGTASWTGTIATPSIDTVSVYNYQIQSNGTNDNVYTGPLSITSAAPEPSSMALFAMGGGLLCLLALRKWRKITPSL